MQGAPCSGTGGRSTMASPRTTSTGALSDANGGPASPLPLEAGDRLTRAEFERRYDAMPELKKAELTEGVVHMPSPVRWQRHARPHSSLMIWLGTYDVGTPGTQSGDN